jgi:hypothetical protein
VAAATLVRSVDQQTVWDPRHVEGRGAVSRGKPELDLAAALDQVVADLAGRYPDRSRDEIARQVGQLAAELASQATVPKFLPTLVARSLRGELDNGGGAFAVE